LTALGRLSVPVRVVAAQQERCAPMVAPFHAGCARLRPQDVVPRPSGLAVATLLGDPSASYPSVREALLATGGTLAGYPGRICVPPATNWTAWGSTRASPRPPRWARYATWSRPGRPAPTTWCWCT